jgi:uncharacterized membrane protein YgdD (TMEM256/DUF423 family)
MQKKFISIGSVSAALAVGLGALGAHALKKKVVEGILSADNLSAFETAVKYQMYHALALLLLAALSFHISSKWLNRAGWCFAGGTILFSGSIYFLSLAPLTGSSFRWLGPVTPLGGLLFICGWIFLLFSVLKNESKS